MFAIEHATTLWDLGTAVRNTPESRGMMVPSKKRISPSRPMIVVRSLNYGIGSIRTVVKKASRLRVPSICDVTCPLEVADMNEVARYRARPEPITGQTKATKKNSV